MTTPVGIKYVGLHENSGYGIAARRYLLGLRRSGVPLTWTPMVPGGKLKSLYYTPFEGRGVGDPQLDPLCNRPIAYDVVILHTVPEYYPMLAEREEGKHVVGCTVWETDRVPRHWPGLLNRMDHLMVPCSWNQQVFKRCGVTPPISVIPHIAASEEPDGRRGFRGIPDKNYVFYTIGAWTTRKAPWKTIACYLQTFSARDPVTLVVKTSKRDFTRPKIWRFRRTAASAFRKLVRGRRGAPDVRLIRETSPSAMCTPRFPVLTKTRPDNRDGHAFAG